MSNFPVEMCIERSFCDRNVVCCFLMHAHNVYQRVCLESVFVFLFKIIINTFRVFFMSSSLHSVNFFKR